MALIKVRVKNTGQTGTMDSSEFDPNVFEQINQPSATQTPATVTTTTSMPQQPQESTAPISESLSKKGILGALLAGAIKPGEQGLRFMAGSGIGLGAGLAGILGNKNAQELALRGDIPLLTKEQEDIFRGNDVGKVAEQGLRSGAGLASYAIPGATGKRAFLTGATRGALSSSSGQGTDAADVILGGATGGIAEGVLSNIIPALKSFGKKTEEAGAGLETRSLLKKFGKPNLKEGGVPALDEFKNQGFNLKGNADDLAQSAADVLNTDGPKVHQVATSLTEKGVQVDKNDVVSFLQSELAKKKTPEMQKPIKEVLDTVQQTFGDKPMNLDEFYIAKQEWGQLGKWSPTATTADNTKAAIYEDLYKKANQIMNDKFKENGVSNFSELNKRVSTAIKALHFAERRNAQIVPDNPLGLMDIAATGVGTGIGGGPGAVVGYAANKLAQSPNVQGAAGRSLQGLGERLQGVNIPQNLMSLLGRGAAISSTSGVQPSATVQPEPTPQVQPQTNIPAPTGAGTKEAEFGKISPEMLAMARLTLKEKEYAKLKDIYDIQQTGKTTMTEQKRKMAMSNALNTYKQVKDISQAAPAGLSGWLISKAGTLPGVEGGSAEDLKRVTEGLAKSIATAFAGESGVATDRDVERWLGLMPKPGDTKAERERALSRLEGAIRLNMQSTGMDPADFGL